MNRILLFLSLSLTIIACSNADHYEGSTAAKTMVDSSPALEVEVPRTQEPGAPSTFEATPRKLIRTGSMHCEVGSLDTAREQLLALLEGYQGYVSSENASSRYRDDLRYTLRVPEAKFDNFVIAVEGISKEVISRNISVTDVTDQYVDIAARLSTKRALHKRYTQLLAKAKNVKEVIEVERELATVLADIESAEARLKSLGNRANYATLDLSFSTEAEPVAQAGFFSELSESFSNGWEGVKIAVLLGATLWPLALFGILLAVGVRWFIRNRSAKLASA
jgi:hypothetical protein